MLENIIHLKYEETKIQEVYMHIRIIVHSKVLIECTFSIGTVQKTRYLGIQVKMSSSLWSFQSSKGDVP